MKRYAPLLTLLAVAVLGGVLFVLNVANDPANRPPAAPAAAPSAAPTTVDLAQAAGPTTTTIDLSKLAPAADTPPEKAYAGRSAGNEVTVAIAVKDGRAIAYVCDGKKIEAWLEGTVSGKDVTLESADGKVKVAGQINDSASLGGVVVGGKSLPYSAQAVVAPGGLYEGRANVRGVATRIGWIVENDGRKTGNQRVEGEAEPRPAPELDLANLGGITVDGVPVTITRPDGDDEVIQ